MILNIKIIIQLANKHLQHWTAVNGGSGVLFCQPVFTTARIIIYPGDPGKSYFGLNLNRINLSYLSSGTR